MPQTLVTAKVHPDLDGVSCALAYADLLNQTGGSAEGLVFGTPQAEVRFFMEQGIVVPVVSPDTNKNWANFILVDASSMKDMPPAIEADRVGEIIDHREGEYKPEELPNAKPHIKLVGAAATLIVERFQNRGLLPHPDHAKLLYGAIFHNTLNFLSSNTTNRDKSAAKWLEDTFDLTPDLIREMFTYATSEITSNLGNSIAQDAKEMSSHNIKIGAYQLIVWNLDIPVKEQEIMETVKRLMIQSNLSVGFLSICQISHNRNDIYIPNSQSADLLTKALGITFDENGWSNTHPMLLRKQIMPKIRDIISSS